MIFLIFLLERYTWYGPFNISNSERVHSKWGDVVIDRNNKIWIVWSEDYYYHPTKMTYRYYTEKEGWSDTFVLIKQGADAYNSQLSLDSLGRIHWIWSYLSDGGIYWSMYEKDKWRKPERIGNDFGSNEGASITSSPDNRTHIVWYVYGEEKTYYMFFEGDTWSTPQVISGSRRARPYDIASDRHNRIHVIWRNLDTGQLEYIVNDGGRWGEPEVLTDVEGTYIRDGKIVVDSQDRVHIVYETAPREPPHSHIYYMENNGSSWTPTYKVDLWDGDEGGGFFPDIGVDSKGIVHIMFSSGESKTPWRLTHAMYDGEEWLTYYVKEEPDSLFHSNEGDVELFIDREDNLYVTVSVNVLPFSQGSAFEVFLYTTNQDMGIKEIKTEYKPVVNVSNEEVSITLKKSYNVRFFIYDTAGRKIYSKDLGVLNKGRNRIKIDKNLSAGVYFTRFDFDGFSISKRIIVK